MQPPNRQNFRVRRHIGLILLLVVLLPACATSSRVFLNDADRNSLRNAPAIHVVRYATPVPEVKPPTASRHLRQNQTARCTERRGHTEQPRKL